MNFLAALGCCLYLASGGVADEPAASSAASLSPDSDDLFVSDLSQDKELDGSGTFEDGSIYSNTEVQRLILAARGFDPNFVLPEKDDRDQAIAFYEQAIEAEPDGHRKAVIANRVAQLYGFYADRSKGYRPDFEKAAQWWTKCAEWTDSTQLLWAEAQMGLASTAVVTQQSEDAKSAYDKILSIDPNSIQLDESIRYSMIFSQADPDWRSQELELLRERLVEMQERAREKRAYADRISTARKQLLRYRERQSLWSLGRLSMLVLNAIVVVGLGAAIVIMRRRRSRSWIVRH